MAACGGVAPSAPNTAKVLKFRGDSAQLPFAKAENRARIRSRSAPPSVLGIRMKVGHSGGGGGFSPQTHGGSGSHGAQGAKGGSGEKGMPPGLAKKGGSGEKGM